MKIKTHMGTFMSKHCSPMSYGTPLEKKSCANYGTPLNQFQDEAKKTNSMTSPHDKLTQRQRDSLQTEVRRYNIKKYDDPDYKHYYVPKFNVVVDPEDGVLVNPGNFKGNLEVLPEKK